MFCTFCFEVKEGVGDCNASGDAGAGNETDDGMVARGIGGSKIGTFEADRKWDWGVGW